MRFTTIILSGLVALASAQDASKTTVTAPTSVDPATAAQNSQQAAIIRCIEACKPGDVNCTSKCIAVPNPDEDAVNATNDCAAKCPQGNGSEAETKKFSDCVQGCIGKHYFTATAGVPPAATGGASGGNGNGGGNGGSGSGNGEGAEVSGDASGSGATPAATDAPGSGAGALAVSSTLGFLGFVAAVMAL